MKIFTRLPVGMQESRTLQWLILLAGPGLVSGVLWAANIVAGTAFAPGCGVVNVVLDATDHTGMLDAAQRLLPWLDVLQPGRSTCHSVPFSADLPNMVLSLTAGLALSVHLLFDLRLNRLRSELEASGLIITTGLRPSPLGEALKVGLHRRRSAPFENILLIVISLVGSAAMYFWLYTRGPIFRDLAGSYTRLGSADVTTELLRQNWWANHTTHPVNTALGVAVGAIGLFFAMKQGSIFVGMARLLIRLRSLERPVAFVPRWLDRDYGWRPVNGLVSMGVLAIFAFLVSFSAALYALRSDQPGLSGALSILLAVIAVAAGTANGVFLISLIATIRKLFADSVAEEKTRILGALRGVTLSTGRRRLRAIDRLALLTEGNNLSDVPDYPISGRWLRFIGVVPAFLGALWTFSNEVGRAFGI